ncbi:cytochrome c [Pseudomonas parakoreensis]
MCVGCHLAPGLTGTELSNSLYPAPPNLSKLGVDGHPAAAFWIIKHGIKSTGMPAWAKAWPIRTYRGWSHFSSSFRHLIQSNTKP